MQMHAYLESLLKFSDVEPEMVSVLYCEMKNIRYEKLMGAFPGVNWIKESKFENNLKAEIENAGEYIMFGCDDVVFTGKFSVNKAAEYLEKNPQVFGFSMRLGENIKPYPKNLSKDENVLEWKWEGCGEQHYNYPWELDCTLYRKEDVLKLTMEEENPIKNPNYYEAMITSDNREKRILRKNMASNRKCGKAVVITVNRVQDTHQNGFDDSMHTDIYSLDRLYNDEDNTLDIEKIANMDNSMIHVGAEYFVLRKPAKGYSSKYLIKKRVKMITERMTRFPKRVYRHFERKRYEKGRYVKRLNILNTEETLKLMENESFCFLRYGDGEITIMKGGSIPFQEYDEKLAKRLKRLLRADKKGLRIGIPYYYTHPVQNLNEFVSKFARSLSTQRKFLCQYCGKDITYIDTAITQVYQTYQKYDFKDYYSRMQNLLKDRDITIICGEGVLDKLEYKAYDVCKTVTFITAPSMNAYAKYEEILKAALKTDKKRLVCIILGPTAKALVCDLYKKGYQAWDMGHYFKDYDSYMKKRPRTDDEITRFYKPD
ncbi:MAG: GT-D fold domain-containing protein [Lachnospiraceae bacterium]|nr:GT-D fold domain-containing protein [Lachnospiraceae bacterium]